MEMVDIVDENLRILYQTSKKEAHIKGLLHKCVIAVLINSAGEIMLIKPYAHKQDAGQYVFPVGGHVSAGETDEDALKREVKEEINISDFRYKLIGNAIFDRHILGRHENHYFILYEIYSDEKPDLQDEAEFSRWFTREALKKEIKTRKKDFGDAFLYAAAIFYQDLF